MKIIVKKKITIEDIFVWFVSIYLFIQTLSTGVQFDSGALEMLYIVQSTWWNFLRLLILIKIGFQFQKKDIKLIFALIIAFCSSYFASAYWVSEIIWIIVGTKRVDLRKLIKHCFVAELLSFLIVVGMCGLGLVNDVTITRDSGMLRHALGFNHPNAFAARVFQLQAMYVYLLNKRIRRKNIIVLIMIDIFVYLLTNSKTVTILLLLMIFFVVILDNIYRTDRLGKNSVWKKLNEGIMKKLKYVAIVIPSIATFFMLYLSNESGQGSLSARASQAAIYFQHYGVTLFGQPLQTNNTAENFYLQQSKLYTLDNSYMYLLIGYGVICFAIFIVCEVLLIYRTIRKKEYTTVVILILYMIYGIVETMTIRFTYNFSLILLAQILWKERQKEINENIIYRA